MGRIGDNHEVLELCELEKGTYASLCYDAMCFLAKQWYLVTDSENDDAPVLERNYVLSLVFQLGKMSAHIPDFGTNVFPSGENNKHLDADWNEIGNTYKELYEKEIKPPFVIIPNLVIHTSHNAKARNSNGQYVAIEAKTTKDIGRTAFMRDLFKLNMCLSSLSYKKVIYLIVNTKRERIEYLIKKYFDEKYYISKENLNNLLFFVQENKDNPPCVYKLSESYINLVKEKYEEVVGY